jgi:alpha-D-xyloside xylohydrolase
VLPWGAREDRPDYDWADGVTLRCFALPDGYDGVTVVPGLSGADATTFRVRRKGNTVTATSDDATADWSLQVGSATASAQGAATLSIELPSTESEDVK